MALVAGAVLVVTEATALLVALLVVAPAAAAGALDEFFRKVLAAPSA